MAISMTRFVDITSGIGAGVRVAGRDLIGRLFTTSTLVPVDTEVTFENAADMADFFGSDSELYKRGAFYFGFISKTQVRARKISVCRYTPEAVAPTLRGVLPAPALETFQAISDGSLALTIGGNRHEITELNFMGAVSYADVASVLEAGLRAADEGGMFACCTVAFDARTKTFLFTGGSDGDREMAHASNAEYGSPLAAQLRWNSGSGAIASNGKNATGVTDALNHSTDASNNYGSFLFLENLTLDQMEEAARFAHLSNIQFIYCQRVDAENYADARERLKDYSGTALTIHDPANAGEFDEMCPMILLAATDYSRLNGTLNYMFHQFGIAPKVTDNATADLFDAARINYYGRTQQAGQLIDFYMRGVLQGDIQDMNVYANEMWFKDRAGADIMSLQLNLPEIAANDEGIAKLTGCLQNVIGMALNNGAISIGKPLNHTQKTFIREITGDDLAWVQVQSLGYWLKFSLEEVTAADRVEWVARYLLVYSKKDAIRKVEGTHSLI